MIHALTGILFAYVMWRLVVPMPWDAQYKWLAVLVLFLISQHYLFLRLFFGSLASPELPYGVHLLLGWLFGAFILLAFFLFVRDLAALVLGLVRLAGLIGGHPSANPRWNEALAILALALGAVGVWQALRVPQVETLEIRSSRLPAVWDGLRLVQISDLHASRLLSAPWVGAVVERANALNPDLVLLTGDLVDGTVDKRAADVAPLRMLKAKHGVYAILGNHEYYSNVGQWSRAFADLGLDVLVNRHVVLSREGARLVLAGVSDPVAAGFGTAVPDAAAALLGTNKTDFIVLMAHRPGSAVAYAGAGVDLQLSGHTHGGQIFGLHLLTKWANAGFVAGLYRVGDMQLYINRGTGLWAGFPMRLGVPAEITQIILRRAE